MKNFKEENMKLIGAKVPKKFAEKFSAHCRAEKFNQRKLFYNLLRWWYEQDEPTQWLIYRGKYSQNAANDETAAASTHAKSQHSEGKRRSATSG